jgi:hypothetical protein
MGIMRLARIWIFLLLAGLASAKDVTNDRNTLDARHLRLVREFQFNIGLQATQAHIGDDGTLVAGYTENGVAVYNALTGAKIADLDTGGEHPHDGAMSADGRYYAVAMDSQDVVVYELRTGKKLETFQVDSGYA